MSLACGQVSIPTIDSYVADCKSFTSSECVIFLDDLPYLGLSDKPNLKDVIDAMLSKIEEQETLINNLRIEIDTLK